MMNPGGSRIQEPTLQLGTVDLLFPVDVTPRNGFEVVHGFSHQNEKVYHILNHCQLATLTARIRYHLIISTFHHSKTITTHHSVHYLSHAREA